MRKTVICALLAVGISFATGKANDIPNVWIWIMGCVGFVIIYVFWTLTERAFGVDD